MICKPGDWIRFYQNGRLVIGVVQYVDCDNWQQHHEAHTDIGGVMCKDIKELRRGDTPTGDEGP